MLNVPEKISDILHKDGVKKLFQIHFPNGEHEDIFNDHIEEETVSFKESVNSGPDFKLGLCETPEISFDLWNVGEITRGTEIECYNNIPYENPEVLLTRRLSLYPTESEEYGDGYRTIFLDAPPHDFKLSNPYFYLELELPEELILKRVYLHDDSKEDGYDIVANGEYSGTTIRVNMSYNAPKDTPITIEGLFFVRPDGSEGTEHLYASYKIIQGAYLDAPDVSSKIFYPIKYGQFVVTEASIYADTPNKLSIRANNYLIDNLTNEIYDDKSFVKTKNAFTYKYDPLRRAIAASGITDSNMWTLANLKTSTKTVKPAEFYSKSISASVKVKQKKKSDAMKSTKLTFKFWFNGDDDLMWYNDYDDFCNYYYGKCTDDNLLQVVFKGNPRANMESLVDRYIDDMTKNLEQRGVIVTKKVKNFIKDEVMPVWFGCYFTSIKNYKKSTSYDRYATPHNFGTCYYTKFTAASAENYDYIVAIPNAIRLTISASTAIENWGKKKEITYPEYGSYDTLFMADPQRYYFSSRWNASIHKCESEMFGEFTFEETAAKVEDSSYYMLFNQVKVRDILSSYFEFKGAYGRVDRNGSFEVSSLTNSLGLMPSEDLYPSDTLYPRGASLDKIIGMDEYSDLFHINNEEKPFGALYAYYTDNNNETQLLIEYADGFNEETDPTSYRSYVMDSNLFVLRKNWTASKLKTYLKDVIAMLNKLIYMEGEATIVGRPDIQAGDTILIEDIHGIHCLVVSDRTINGVQHLVDTIKSV